ncbi:MAG: hypothetical protein ACKVYV_17795 [Limisphaerales bacterium]
MRPAWFLIFPLVLGSAPAQAFSPQARWLDDGTNLPPGAVLRLPGRDDRGRLALNPAGFSLRLLLRPDWSSTNEPGGRGPGAPVALFRFGGGRDGVFALTLDASGTRLGLRSAAGAEPGRDFAIPYAARFVSNVWSEVIVNLFPDRSYIVQGGTVLQLGGGLGLQVPGPAAVAGGLEVATGGGRLAAVEARLTPFTDLEIFHDGIAMSAAASDAPTGLRVAWRLNPNLPFELERAPDGTTNWTVVHRGTGGGSWFDASVQPGEVWQYRVVTNRHRYQFQDLRAGLRAPAIEDRGAILLLVDETLARGLRAELGAWERDVFADGWRVLRREAPRHDDARWEANPEKIARVKAMVLEAWQATAGRLRAVFLVGHVAVPYAGFQAEDSHTGRGDNHFGAWPSDVYYGDMDGVWTDRESQPAYILMPVTHPETRNVPGDGKWDTAFVATAPDGNTRLEASVARADFAKLPGVYAATRRNELELTRAWFNKVRRWRAGLLRAEARLVAEGFFQGGSDLSIWHNAGRLGPRLFGDDPAAVVRGDLFAATGANSFLFGLQSAAGASSRIRNGGPNQLTAAQIAALDPPPAVAFTVLLGSWFGDYNLGEDNVLRAMLATRDHGLATVWTRFTLYQFDVLALGGTLGDAMLRTANDSIRHNDHNTGTTRTCVLLGDPTLRWSHLAPPARLSGRRGADGVTLTWRNPPGAEGCHVYRQAGGGAPLQRLTTSPVAGEEFRDATGGRESTYLVRAVRLETTGSGSYTNLSGGAWWP